MSWSLSMPIRDGVTLVVTWGKDDVSITEISEKDDGPGSATTITLKHKEALVLHQFILSSLTKGENQ